MAVDHTIAFPSNFPQNVKNIDVFSAKNLYKDHNTLEFDVIVALVENFESYLKEGQFITTIIVLENKCQGEFSRLYEVYFRMAIKDLCLLPQAIYLALPEL
jgi:hypothetical protein